MRRRLTVAIVAVVVGALAVAGAGSLLLANRADRNQFRQRLYSQAHVISSNLDTLVFGSGANRRNVLAILAEVSRLEGVAIAVVEPNGDVTPIQPSAPLLGLFGRTHALPSGLTSTELNPAALRDGKSTSGTRGSLLWAAVPTSISASALIPPGTSADRAAALERRLATVTTNGQLPIAVIVTGKDKTTPGATTYFLIAAITALAVAVLVAGALARRIARPLRAVEATAGRIASGDLNQRVQVDPGEYPEVASLATSINTMAESLQAARELERQFFMSISHDLRTPLTSIRGWAEAIADDAVTDQQQAARIIGAESRRLERLVQDLLDLARLDSHAFSLRVRETDVSAVVADTAEGFRPMVEQAGLTLHVLAPSQAIGASADPDRLAQVVANLVENAYKHASSRIRVATTSVDGTVAVTVEDDGPGMSPDERLHAFERLYQSARTPARQAGSGLGLAIVKELTAAMGGTVSAEPATEGSGSLLRVTLCSTAGGS